MHSSPLAVESVRRQVDMHTTYLRQFQKIKRLVRREKNLYYWRLRPNEVRMQVAPATNVSFGLFEPYHKDHVSIVRSTP